METKRERGRPEGKNFEFIKSIKLNQKQVDNWDSKRIKAFLNGEMNDSNIMNDFKRLYQIVNLFIIDKLTDKQIINLKEQLEQIENIEEGYNFE